jgi:hypothetical protein
MILDKSNDPVGVLARPVVANHNDLAVLLSISSMFYIAQLD